MLIILHLKLHVIILHAYIRYMRVVMVSSCMYGAENSNMPSYTGNGNNTLGLGYPPGPFRLGLLYRYNVSTCSSQK